MARPSPRPDYNSDNFGQQAYAKKPRSAYRVGLVYLCFFAPCLFVLFFVTLAAFDFAVLVALVVFGVDATTGIARTVDAFRSVLPQTFALSTTESALTLFEKCLRLGCEWAGIARDGTANASVLDQWWTTSAPAMRGNLVRIASLLDGNRVSHDAAKAVTLQVSFSGIHFTHYSTDRQALRLDALGGIMRYFDRDFNLIRLRMILTRAVQPLAPSRITLRPSNDTPPVSCRD